MSKPTDNSKNELNDFLDHAGKPGFMPADDFEKDAAEGFAMLDNEEALDLKSKLDARMDQQLFSAKQQGPKKTVWLAAAALVMIIGFTVYFIRTGENEQAEKIAINSSMKEMPPPAAEISAPTEPLVKEEADKAAPPEEKRALKLDQAAKPEEASNKASYKYKIIKPPVEEEDKQSDTWEKTSKAQMEADWDAGTVNASPAKPANDQRSEPVEKKDDQPVVKAAREKESKKRKSEAATEGVADKAAAPMAAPPAPGEHLASDAPLKEAEEVQEDKMVLQSKNEQTVLVPGSTVISPSTTYNAPASGGFANGPATPQLSYTVAAEASYTGGNAALQKDLKEKLAAKNLVQKFDAIVFITKTNTVDKVKFANAYALTKDQQQQVQEILKTLKKFTVSNLTQKSSLYEIMFRP